MTGCGSFGCEPTERRGLDAASHLGETAMSDIINFGTLQLRFLQTMLEMSSERTSNLILPIPLELFKPFLGGGNDKSS